MAILQFAFGADARGQRLPAPQLPANTVVYTGTHDNDTVVGLVDGGGGGLDPHRRGGREGARARPRLPAAATGREIHWDFIRTRLGSVADTAIVPLQDVLGAGTPRRA